MQVNATSSRLAPLLTQATWIALLTYAALGCAGSGNGSPASIGGKASDPAARSIAADFDSQGHRGARGLLPENSVAAARLAVELDMRTVELDLAVSADDVLVVSHEPTFNPTICALKGSRHDTETSLHGLTYAEIARVDCGARRNPEFPKQRPVPGPKPKLTELVTAADARARELGRDLPHYNIEIKTEPALDSAYTPTPARFAELVAAAIDELGIASRATVQAFDARPLVEFHRLRPAIPVAYLTARPLSVEGVNAALGFRPRIYSPYHLGLTESQVSAFHSAGYKVIPWTVNDVSRMRALIAWGVDGLITDYPDRLQQLLASYARD